MHLIQQHTFDIQCSSQNSGKEIHSQLSMLLEKEFYPQLEILFNRYDSKLSTLRIDLLDIEIQPLSKRYWKEELIQKSLLQIEDYLKRNQLVDSVKKDQLNSHLISSTSHAEHIFIEFLRIGKIIENTLAKDLEKLVNEIEVTEVLIEEILLNFEKNTKYLMRWIFSVPQFFKDLAFKRLNHFPNEIVVFLDNILVTNEKYNSEANDSIKKIVQNNALKKQWIEFIQWMFYLQKRSTSKETIIKEFVQLSEEFWEITQQELEIVCQYILEQSDNSLYSISTEIKEFFQKVKRINPESAPDGNKFQVQENSLKQKDNLLFNNKKNLDLEKDLFQKVKQVIPESASEENKFQLQENNLKQKDNLQFNNKENSDLESVQYIKNAGLVILHPFLKALFEQADLCDTSGNWKSKISQHKAVLLTQYLIDAGDKIQESDLLLNKVLCGFPMEGVINVKLKITKMEKEKCKNLLEAVKEHWKVMNDSSIEALQQTFLQREAKLELVNENDYALWVEEKGVDILLEQLPWGIGMIQTPWMENYLNCHWS